MSVDTYSGLEKEPATYVDLHVHTKYSRVKDGVAYTPGDAVRQAQTMDLGGMALTGHDTFDGVDEALEAAHHIGNVILIPGVEITTFKWCKAGFHIPHLIGLFSTEVGAGLVGTNPPTLRDPAYVADWIHGHDGVVIAPHAKKKGNPISLSQNEIRRLGDRVDAVETHTQKGGNIPAQQLAMTRAFSSVGASDAHLLGEIGLARTMVLGECTTAEDVLQAIKAGRVQGVRDEAARPAWRGRRAKDHIKAYVRSTKS